MNKNYDYQLVIVNRNNIYDSHGVNLYEFIDKVVEISDKYSVNGAKVRVEYHNELATLTIRTKLK